MEETPDARDISLLLKEKYGGVRTPEAERDIARLRRGEHLDYIIGFVPFLGLRIDVSRRPLIPRAETEHWTDLLLSRYAERADREPVCLDMFAGSGCVGIAVLARVPGSRVVFADIDPSCLEQIRINLKENGIHPSRALLVQSDGFSEIKGTFDLITANPPYIPQSRRDLVQPSVLRSEPPHALFGGDDGLEIIRPFVKNIRAFLRPEGLAVMEFGEGQEDVITSLLEGMRVRFERDQFGEMRTAWISHTGK